MELQVDEKLLYVIPGILGILQAFKAVPVLNKLKEWFPLLSIMLGVVASCSILEQPLAAEIIAGVVLGAAASGAFSGLKSTAQLARNLEDNGDK